MVGVTLVWDHATRTGRTGDGYEMIWEDWRSACCRFAGGRMTVHCPDSTFSHIYAPHLGGMAFERAGRIIVAHRQRIRAGQPITRGPIRRLPDRDAHPVEAPGPRLH